MDRSTSPERGQSSHTRRETRPTHETSQESIERMRRENTRGHTNYENKRAHETPQDQQRRLEAEYRRFHQGLALSAPHEEAFTSQWQRDYINRERTERGFGSTQYLDYTENQIKEYAKICLEAELITTGEQVENQDQVARKITEDINFRRTLNELNISSIDRSSDDWKNFRVDKFDDIASRYKLDQKEDRMLMLADIMQYERGNRCTIDQLNSKEYKTILKFTIQEWKDWQSGKNSSPS